MKAKITGNIDMLTTGEEKGIFICRRLLLWFILNCDEV